MAYITRNDLITFTKKYIDDTDTDLLALMDSYCNSAMEAVKKYLGYDPEKKEYVSIISGDNGTMLALEAQPIVQIKEFSIDSVSQETSKLRVVTADQNYVRMTDNKFFCKDVEYKVKYDAGFVSVPQLIKLTALQIASLFMESSGGNLAVSSTSFADAGTRVFNNFTMDRFLKQIEEYRMVIR